MGVFKDPFGIKKAANTQKQIAADAANEATSRENARVAAVQGGKDAIDKAFAQFNPDFFGKMSKAYVDNYTPQVDQQYTDAQDKLKATLAGQGVLESGVGNDAMARLARQRATAMSSITSQGQDAANTLQRNIDNSKTSLYSANAAAADPSSAAANATATATSLAAPQQYSPLADLFSGMLSAYGAYRQGANGTPTASGALYAPSPGSSYSPSTASSIDSGSSVRTIG